MKDSGIRTNHILSYLVDQAGGHEKLGFESKDLYNKLYSVKAHTVCDMDAATAIGYLQRNADNDVGYFGKYTVDYEDRLVNMFWTDSESRYDYELFGRVLAFDSTYKTNIYGKPLLVFVGVNNHFKTTIFGFAILVDETVETYSWAITTFLESMGGNEPSAVITDGDNAMRRAIADVLPNAIHRLCTWHIINNATKHVHNVEFIKDLKPFMFRLYSPEEFESRWAEMVRSHNIEGNEWVRSIYEKRQHWAETYLCGHFFAGMTTTQRCEGMHAHLKGNLKSSLSLYKFVRFLDVSLMVLRHNDSKEDFTCVYTLPPPRQTNMPEIEEQAANVYTRNIFFRVRREMQKEGKYMVTADQMSGTLMKFTLIKYGSPNSSRVVVHDEVSDEYHCDCNMLSRIGLPCKHIFSVLKSLHITQLPPKLINARWTKAAKESRVNEEIGKRLYLHNKNREAQRFGQITAEFRKIASEECQSEAKFKLALQEMEGLMQKLAGITILNSDDVGEEDKANLSHTCVKNPTMVRSKGKPRNLPTKKGKTQCSKCHKFGHNRATCSKRKRRVEEEESEQDDLVNNITIDVKDSHSESDHII